MKFYGVQLFSLYDFFLLDLCSACHIIAEKSYYIAADNATLLYGANSFLWKLSLTLWV